MSKELYGMIMMVLKNTEGVLKNAPSDLRPIYWEYPVLIIKKIVPGIGYKISDQD